MLTCVFSLLSVHSCSSMGPPILYNVVSDLGSKTEEEGLFSSIFLSLDTIVSAMSSVNIKNIFFFLRKLSRTRESLISSIWWKPRLCLKEPPTFLGDGPGQSCHKGLRQRETPLADKEPLGIRRGGEEMDFFFQFQTFIYLDFDSRGRYLISKCSSLGLYHAIRSNL